jgi:photosystem II stability/assembly factor-like uncharacterized protein
VLSGHLGKFMGGARIGVDVPEVVQLGSSLPIEATSKDDDPSCHFTWSVPVDEQVDPPSFCARQGPHLELCPRCKKSGPDTGRDVSAEIYRSEDRGKTWTALRAGFAESCPAVVIPRVTQILIDPHDSDAIWATVEIDGIWRSLDGGKTWAKHVTGAISEDGHGRGPGAQKRKACALSDDEQGIEREPDEGQSWEFRPLDKPWQYQRSIALRADDSGVIVLTIGDNVPGSTGSLMRIRDFGETWEDAGLAGETMSRPWCIATNPADPNLIFVATILGKFFRSIDGGETWTKLPRELGETRSLLWLPS